MEEIKDKIIKPQWHYEVVKEYKKEIPIYDEDGNEIGKEEIVTGRVLKKVLDDDLLKKQERIAELKQLLASSDYKAIKYAEGLISAEDYEPIKQERQAYREEINQLEAE